MGIMDLLSGLLAVKQKCGLSRALDGDRPHFSFFKNGALLFAISLHI